MNPCKLKEPKVINNALLEKCVIEQGPTGEAGRLAEMEKIPLEEVAQIRLEFMSTYLNFSLINLHSYNKSFRYIENRSSLASKIINKTAFK